MEIAFTPETREHFNSRSISALEYCICEAKIELPIVICDGQIWGYEKAGGIVKNLQPQKMLGEI